MGNLIDDIFLQTKLGYISDMRFDSNIDEVLQAIHKIPKEAYSKKRMAGGVFLSDMQNSTWKLWKKSTGGGPEQKKSRIIYQIAFEKQQRRLFVEVGYEL